MGLGQALSEARRHDPATGRLLTDSLWTYHPPIAASMPQELNVTLLPVRCRPRLLLLPLLCPLQLSASQRVRALLQPSPFTYLLPALHAPLHVRLNSQPGLTLASPLPLAPPPCLPPLPAGLLP